MLLILLESPSSSWLFLGLIVLFSCTYAQQQPKPLTIAWSGNYRMLQCGSDGQAGSRASVLQNILPKLWSNLQAAIANSQLGTSSTHGFKAFFKTNENKVTVQNLYQKMIDGPPVLLAPQRAQRFKKKMIPLTFVCANQGDPHTEFIYKSLCEQNMPVPAGQWPDSELVGLCPLFFNLGTEGWVEPPSGFCPILLDNAISPNGNP